MDNMEKSRLRQLLTDYSLGTISGPDLEALLDYVAEHHGDADLDSLLEEMLEDTELDFDLRVDSEGLYRRIVEHPRFSEQPETLKRRQWWWYGAAAILLLAGGWFLQETSIISTVSKTRFPAKVLTKTVTTSPTDRLILRLANGKIIDLDSASNGALAMEGGTKIVLDGNVLYYHSELRGINNQLMQNTIITPKGRQYQLVLPDGSKVWLNAATRLVYPVKFAGDKREVEVNGEAYFEIAKASKWPFIVKTTSQQVEVIGTHFNVSAYDDDDDVRTSLVEGVVKVSPVESFPRSVTPQGGRPSIILKPGQQAVIQKGNRNLQITKIDPNEIVSWKDNLFAFHNEEISGVMKKVSRWYDVEIHYLDGMAGKRIGGSIPRFANIKDLMDALQATGVLRYQMKGGVVVIMK